MIRFIYLIFFGLITLLAGEWAFAAASLPIGQVVWTHGVVKAVSPQKVERTLERRSPIYEQDTIVTHSAASGEIVLADNTVITLRDNSALKIDQYKFNEKNPPQENKSIINLAKGGFRTITGLISKKNPASYEVNTPVATIGVRGTDYSIFYAPATGLEVKLSQGKIQVSNTAGTVQLDAAKNVSFAQIRGLKIAPVITPKESPVFKKQPAITPVGHMGSPGGTPPSPPVAGQGSVTTTTTTSTTTSITTSSTPAAVAPQSSSPSKSGVVSEFCIN